LRLSRRLPFFVTASTNFVTRSTPQRVGDVDEDLRRMEAASWFQDFPKLPRTRSLQLPSKPLTEPNER
jgi:hypothetical protein